MLACLNASEVGWLSQTAIAGLSGLDLQTKIANDADKSPGTPGAGPALATQLTYPSSANPGIANQVGWLTVYQVNELISTDLLSLFLLSSQVSSISATVFSGTKPSLNPYVLIANVVDKASPLVQCLTADQISALTADLVNGTEYGVPNIIMVANAMTVPEVGNLCQTTVQNLTYKTLMTPVLPVVTDSDPMSLLSALTSPQVFWLQPDQLAPLTPGDFSKKSIGIAANTVFIDEDGRKYALRDRFAVLESNDLKGVSINDNAANGLLLVMSQGSSVTLYAYDTTVNMDGSGSSTVYVQSIDKQSEDNPTLVTFNQSGNIHLGGVNQVITLNGPAAEITFDAASTVNQTLFDYGGRANIAMANDSWGHIFGTGDMIAPHAGYFDLTGHDNTVMNSAFGDVLYLYGSRNKVSSAVDSYLTPDDEGVQVTVRPDGTFLVQAISSLPGNRDFIAAGVVSKSQERLLDAQSVNWLATHH